MKKKRDDSQPHPSPSALLFVFHYDRASCCPGDLVGPASCSQRVLAVSCTAAPSMAVMGSCDHQEAPQGRVNHNVALSVWHPAFVRDYRDVVVPSFGANVPPAVSEYLAAVAALGL
eukprot:m51a1_g8916 hypothetical protein (116) ;mRNA; r:791328-798656